MFETKRKWLLAALATTALVCAGNLAPEGRFAFVTSAQAALTPAELTQGATTLAGEITTLQGTGAGTTQQKTKLAQLARVVSQLRNNIATASSDPAEIAFLSDELSSLQGQFTKLKAQIGPIVVTPTDLYVSPTGSDANAGTTGSPLATLGEAVARVSRDATSGKPAAGRTVFMMPGTHYLGAPVVLGPELSGTTGSPFTITAMPRTQPVISGGRKLASLSWTVVGNVWSASTDGVPFDSLFIDGEPQIRARYPNYDPNIRILNGSANVKDSPRVANWTNPAGGFMHVMLNAEWGDIHYEILGKAANGTLNLSVGTGNNRMSQGPNWNVSYVENVFEELDAQQEWFHDVAAKKLYFYPKTGVDPRNALVEVGGSTEQLLVLKGTEAAPVHDVAISGLILTQTAKTFMKTTEPLLRSDWKVFRGGAVFIEGSKDVSVTDNDLQYLGGNAVFVSGYNRGVTVKGNEFKELGASAILFVGSPDAVRSPGFEYAVRTSYANMDKVPGPKTNNYPSLSLADNNLIHDIGRWEKQATGIEISMASEITLRNNSVYKTPRAGINIGDGTWGGHILEYNDVFDTVLETGDHGAFNSWGRDRYWGQGSTNGTSTAELVANPDMPYLDAIKQTVIRNNRFRCDHGWDVDLDDGSSNYLIENNVLLKGGLKFREGFKRIARNNIMVNNSFHPHIWYQNSLDRFERNIVMGAYQPAAWTGAKGDVIDNNLFPTQAALTASRNVSTGWDLNSKVGGDPMFADPLNGDFTVSGTSPALGVGYQNFAMNNFGVQDPRLKPKALKPVFDPVRVVSVVLEPFSDFLGAKVKSVQTEGERSAAGLPSVAGILVQSVLAGSDAANSGVLANDVIVKAVVAGVTKNMDDSNDLNIALGAEAAAGKMRVTVIRSQAPVEFDLLFPSLTVNNDNWSGITYAAGWARQTGRSQASADYLFDVTYNNTVGAQATVSFTGTGIRIIHPVATSALVISVSLDGATAENITIPAVGVYKGQRTVYSISGLTSGPHTLVLKKVSGTFFQLDRVDVTR